METTIQLIQKPEIRHKLTEVGAAITERIAALNIDSQVATDETIKALKAMRADLNKEAGEFEAQRKFIKEAILAPYDQLEAVYKIEIIEKYKAADALLKEKISDFEMKIKIEKRERINAYFDEVCEQEEIHFIKLSDVIKEVTLSKSEKEYKKQIDEKIEDIKSDLSLIATEKEEIRAEILVIYKKMLNASQAIREVRARKEAERIEKARILNDRTIARQRQLGYKFLYSDLTRSMYFADDETIRVRMIDIEEMSQELWNEKYADIAARVDEYKKKQEPKKPEVLHAPTPVQQSIFTAQAAQPEQPTQPAPQPEEPEELCTATFEVTATYKELMRLSEFLKTNNYNYTNL